MKFICAALVLLTCIASSTAAEIAESLRPLLVNSCFDCHNAEAKEGGLDLSSLKWQPEVLENLNRWIQIHDRVQAGEMPPQTEKRPDATMKSNFLGTLSRDLNAADLARQLRDGRGGLRRLSRVELECTLRDLLGLPGLSLLSDLPSDGKEDGFDRAAGALDISFVHMETYLAAVDKALNEATPAFAERPPTFKYRYKPWDNVRHGGREAEGAVVVNVGLKNYVPLIGLERDPTFRVEGWKVIDDEPLSTAFGFFRHDDADFRFSLTAISPVLAGMHKLRVSAYSFWWDGEKAVPTERTGAIGFGIHSTGQHFGSVGVPANKSGVAEVNAWLQRSGGHIHGTDNYVRLIFESCERVRDFPHGEDRLGPPLPCPGLAIEWVEIEGPINEQWPPASQIALFGDLPVQVWKADLGVPEPKQQIWPKGNHGTFPEDIYGEKGEKRISVHVVSSSPEKDARRLLRVFLPRAFRRSASDADVDYYYEVFSDSLKEGLHFQDALKIAYRTALTSPDFLMLGLRRDRFAVASRLSAMLWSSMPDTLLLESAETGELAKPNVLRAQAERLLADPKSERFIEDFTGQWLRLREIEANPPDKDLYPEFMPILQESMLKETRAYFAELLRQDLSVAHFVKSDFAMLNEPLARHYGIDGVSGFAIRRVALPPDSVRGGFMTQGAILKITANGTTTSPVKRGAFVMEKILGIVPTPPPSNAGSIEPDTRGATTIRGQLEKHKRDATCAACHVKIDPYGFALESFDVVGQWRDKYRVRGGEGNGTNRPIVHARPINYRYNLPVDCTGALPDGRTFANIAALREMLAADEETLARSFVSNLIIYSTGAPVSFADRAEVENILNRSKRNHYGVRTLLLETIQSSIFFKP